MIVDDPEHDAASIEAFLGQVARECDDLSPPMQQRVLAGLEQHVRECVSSGAGIDLDLGDAVAYARDFRDALDLPQRPPDEARTDRPLTRDDEPDEGRRGPLRLLVGAGTAVVLGVAILVWWLVRPTSGPPTPDQAQRSAENPAPKQQQPVVTTSASPDAEHVRVPPVVGLPVAVAEARLNQAHLQWRLAPAGMSPAPGATVADTEPRAHAFVRPDLVVTLVVRSG